MRAHARTRARTPVARTAVPPPPTTPPRRAHSQTHDARTLAQVKNVERVELGCHEMETWYFSPFPDEYRECKVGVGRGEWVSEWEWVGGWVGGVRVPTACGRGWGACAYGVQAGVCLSAR